MFYRDLNKIERISLMETYYDEIQNKMLEIDENSILTYSDAFNPDYIEKIKILMDYYFGGTWLQDYEADERGELPRGLKRGILGQDTLYDLYLRLKDYYSIYEVIDISEKEACDTDMK